MSEKEIALPLIRRAQGFQKNTDQKEICNLISTVCENLEDYPKYGALKELYRALSAALNGQINTPESWIINLNDSLKDIIDYRL